MNEIQQKTTQTTPSKPADVSGKTTNWRRGRFAVRFVAAGLLAFVTLWIVSQTSLFSTPNSSGRSTVKIEIPHPNPRRDNSIDERQGDCGGASEERSERELDARDDNPAAATGIAANSTVDAPAQHPIESALRVAEEGLDYIHNHVADYTATIVKRERAKNGKLPERQVMFCKIRHRKLNADGTLEIPFSIYLRFLEPRSIAGREVVWVENQNDGKLIAHEPGIKNLIRFKLDPDGFIAMMGQRYSLGNIGMENLIEKLIERGEEERQHGDSDNCLVEFINHAKLDGRDCTLIEIRHPRKTTKVTCYIARIFFDIEQKIPMRYAAYLWPESADGDLPVDEEYTYRDVKLNVGLTDVDFDPDNPDYEYP